MRCAFFFVSLLLPTTLATAVDLANLPANTFVEIVYATNQLPGSEEKGAYSPQGWNKIVYDPVVQRVLLYDRWVDKKHGGGTIYGNCLFAFDPAAATMTPLKVDHWTKKETPQGGYRTLALPENDAEPTPAPRHVYHAFEFVPDLNSLFICNGANQSIIDKSGKLVGHDACDGAWRMDLKTNRWTKIESKECPPNRLDDCMAWCPPTKSLIYAATGRQLWILDPAVGQWRKAKSSPPPRNSMGQTLFYDPTGERMLIAGGGTLDAWEKGPAPDFHELYAFDPRTETVERLADAPTTLYSSHLAYDSKRQLFFVVAVFNKQQQRSGVFAYDPRENSWREITVAGKIPPHKSWFGWMQLCYDSHHDCLIGKVADKFYAFRYEP
ncbi:MAG TPA: hypothetical protein VFB96_02760 [Pirellulaceae bacterium]|nr:hypothetical protein [Pirellulaceae bacterium]